MKRFVVAVAAALLVAGAAPAFAQANERVTAPVGGISIEKPAGWLTMKPDEAVANLGRVQFDSPEFQRQLEQASAKPLIVFTKYPLEGRTGLIPTIKVNYHRIPQVRQIGAIGMLEAVIEAMRSGFPDLRIVEAPATTTVGGQPAAHVRYAYTMPTDIGPINAVSEMWVIPRGDYVLVVGAAYDRDEPPAAREEILAAVKSVKIAP